MAAGGAPKLTSATSDKISLGEGANATFTCTVASGDLAGLSYEWLRDDKTRIGHNQQQQQHQQQYPNKQNKYRLSIGSDNFQSALRVIGLDQSDSGSYSCIARNQFGQDKVTTWLSVKGLCGFLRWSTRSRPIAN